MKALILGGGGARGAYEAGVVVALTEREQFDIICGTSIGAVNGMLVAQDTPGQLFDMWHTISTRGVTSLKPELAALLLLWSSVNGMIESPLQKKAHHALSMMRALPRITVVGRLPRLLGLFESGNVRTAVQEISDFAALRRTFVVGTTNLTTGRGQSFAYFPPSAAAERQTFFQNDGAAEAIHAANYVDVICASAALPPIYEPVSILGHDGFRRQFADGGFTNNAPIRQAIDAGATEVTAIFVQPAQARTAHRTVSSMLDVMSIMLDANTERMLELDLKLARRINADVRHGTAAGKRHIDLRIIGPAAPLDLPTLGFDDQEELNRLFALGYADGRALAA